MLCKDKKLLKKLITYETLFYQQKQKNLNLTKKHHKKKLIGYKTAIFVFTKAIYLS